MDSTYLVGLLLVGLSAVLLASHWQQWRESNRRRDNSSRLDPRWQAYAARTMLRRSVASSLVGLVGLILMAFESVPHTPISISAYLFSLVFMTCWILWLACLDLLAGRRFQADRQLEEIADQLRHQELEATSSESAKR
jgi:hypothetical protein